MHTKIYQRNVYSKSNTTLDQTHNFLKYVLLLGDRVAVEPHRVCRRCEACKAGRYNMCPHVFFLATPPDSGALARFHVHDADFVFK